MKKKGEKYFVFFIFALAATTVLFSSNVSYSAQKVSPFTCQSGKYPVSNSLSRGLQRILGINILTTQLAEFSIGREIEKNLQEGSVKFNLKGYSAGDLISGKIKNFHITGKNIVIEDVHIDSIQAKSMCGFTDFDYKKNPPKISSPLYLTYSAEITNKGLKKMFASESVKKSMTGITLFYNSPELGVVDFIDVNPYITNRKIGLKANLVYKRTPFNFSFPIDFETGVVAKDNKIFLTNLVFAPDSVGNEFKFITNALASLSNIRVLDLKSLEKDGTKLQISSLNLENDKISVEGKFWAPSGTVFD